jgi:hypothetical protein
MKSDSFNQEYKPTIGADYDTVAVETKMPKTNTLMKVPIQVSLQLFGIPNSSIAGPNTNIRRYGIPRVKKNIETCQPRFIKAVMFVF